MEGARKEARGRRLGERRGVAEVQGEVEVQEEVDIVVEEASQVEDEVDMSVVSAVPSPVKRLAPPKAVGRRTKVRSSLLAFSSPLTPPHLFRVSVSPLPFICSSLK